MPSLLSLLVGFAALLGAPLFVVILAGAMLGFYVAEIPLTVIPIEIYRLIDTPLLLALPLFTFSGYVLAESRLSLRLVHLTQVFLGWLPGGLAVVASSPVRSLPRSPAHRVSLSLRSAHYCCRLWSRRAIQKNSASVW